jgi:hypothetical protein
LIAHVPAFITAHIGFFFFLMHQDSEVVGGFLVTPLIRDVGAGQYLASVSLRRGMHDRVFRFIPRFANAVDALRYALAEGRLLARA